MHYALLMHRQTRPACRCGLTHATAHLDYLNGLGDQLKFAGPFLGEDGKPNGSLVVIDATDPGRRQRTLPPAILMPRLVSSRQSIFAHGTGQLKTLTTNKALNMAYLAVQIRTGRMVVG